MLVARPPSDRRTWPQSIVVGVDGSRSSAAAFEVAPGLATRLGATLAPGRRDEGAVRRPRGGARACAEAGDDRGDRGARASRALGRDRPRRRRQPRASRDPRARERRASGSRTRRAARSWSSASLLSSVSAMTPDAQLDPRGAPAPRRVLARRQLPLRRADLPARQPAAARAARARARQAAAAGPLGHDAGPELPLRAPEPRDQGARPERDLRHRARATAGRRSSRTRTSRAPTREVYPHIGRDEEGLRKLFRQFSFPGGIPSHVAPETPGSIHEGGELGYALVHAYGAAFDNPDLLVCCVVGDGEAETGPLAASWHSNKFLNPQRDGVVLPILHLNGYKIANPTVLARIPEDELRDAAPRLRPRAVLRRGRRPRGDAQRDGGDARRRCSTRSRRSSGRAGGDVERPRWPMIVLRTPKGWTGPKEVDGADRGHVALAPGAARGRDDPSTCAELEAWLRSYRPEELFDEHGRARAGARRARARRRAAHEREPARERRAAASRPRPAGLPRVRRRRRKRRRGRRARRRACSASSCATSCVATPRRSASSAPTRRRPTG